MLTTLYIPSNISIQRAAAYGFLGGFLGWLLLFVFSYLIQLILAPKKQRDESREEIEELKDKLNQINNARPNMVLVKTEKIQTAIKHVRTGEVFGRPWFVRVQFANDPLSPLQAVDAMNVVGHIDIYGQDRKHLLKMIGRWSETKEVAFGGQPMETEQMAIPPNGRPYLMDIAMKYQEDEECYGYNNDNPRLASDWRDRSKKLTVGDYLLIVRLRGNNVDKEFLFDLINKGKEKDIELKSRN